MLEPAYRVLDRVYRDGAFVGIALNDVLRQIPPESRPAVTQLVYGVLERNATLDYYLNALCPRAPKPAIRVLLKIGLYQLLWSNTPAYAAVSGTVNLAKQVGKGAQSGFINAVLKQWESVPVPTGEAEKLSFYSGKPLWYVRAVMDDYETDAREILIAEPRKATHVRGEVENNTPYGAYLSGRETARLDPARTAVMSLGSCAIAEAVEVCDGDRVLDACAAPGGKSVFMAESAECLVTSLDIYPHRVALIDQYAARMGVGKCVRTVTADATVYDPAFSAVFDRALCDVPCSGSGVVFSKPDILLREPDFKSLSAVQNAIVNNVSRYVKTGGRLVYSTCSLFSRENDAVVRAFLAEHQNFSALEKLPKVPYKKTEFGVQLLPDRSDTEGFYFAVLKKNGEN